MEVRDAAALPYKELIFSREQVNARIHEMASEIVERYETSPLFVCLMRGGVKFTENLMTHITEIDPNFHPDVDYMTISTYGAERDAGRPRVVMDIDPRTEVNGRDVVILDDLFDEGHTANFAFHHLQKLGARDVKIAVLGQKQKQPEDGFIQPDMVGFTLPDAWLTGMGMDDANICREANRWAGWVAVAKPNN